MENCSKFFLTEQLSVPSYYQKHLENKIQQVKTLENQGDTFTFGFVTDLHYEANARNSARLMLEADKQLNLCMIVNGGDQPENYIDSPATRTIIQIENMFHDYAPMKNKLLNVMGNHDDNSISTKWKLTMKHEELYDRLFSYMKGKNTDGETGKYYYRDDLKNEVRYIVLDSSDIPYIQDGNDMKYKPIHSFAFRQKQLDWFANVALDVPSKEWSVIVISHAPNTAEQAISGTGANAIRNGDLARGILKAFKNGTKYSGSSRSGVESDFQSNVSVDFSSKGGNVIGWFSGHTHHDNLIQLPEGFPLIVTLNDSCKQWSTAPTRTKGTITEQAFDLITVNKDQRKIYLTRIGAGKDREISY